MKGFLAALLAALLCSACAGGGPAPSTGSGSGSIEMYGTIDEGITFHK
jgi:ABC-type glycerol-3-phosphate transport system substrate-binding protein